jgi:uncharacterized protein (DUF305 family)
MNVRLVFAVFVLSANAGAAEVYKCVENGKTIFQGTPCAGTGNKVTVKPANGTSVSTRQDTDQPSKTAKPTVSKLKQNVEAMEIERRQRDIAYEVRDLERDIDHYQSAMDRELGALDKKKVYAKNNLAGATWEQSISTEMQAVTSKYQSKIQVAQERITQLRRSGR